MLWSVSFALILFANTADSTPDCNIDEVFLPRSISMFANMTRPRYLNCSLGQGNIASKIIWKRKDRILKQGTGPVKWLGLTLEKTAVRALEDLRCEVITGKQNQSCAFSREAPPHITSRKQLYEAYVGTSLMIPCRAIGSPEPKITWIKRGQSLAPQVMPPSIKQIKSRARLDLVIKKVSMMHSGLYTCHAVNRLGKDTHFVLLIVLYRIALLPPRVVPLKHVVTVQTGSTAVLVCSAKNTPRRYSAVFWDHYGTEVKNTARHRIKSRYSVKIVKKIYKDERLATSLTISHVTSEDVGLYTCGVVTQVGRHESHVDLRIKD